MQRQLNLPACLNVRDLGGLPTLDGAQTRWNSLIRADGLFRLTPEGIAAVRNYGVRTIIDLRWPEEIAQNPNPFASSVDGVGFIHLSLLGESEPTWRERADAIQAPWWNYRLLELCKPELAEVMRIIADAPEGCIIFHCHAGKDRTGLIALLLLAVADVAPQPIAQDYADSDVYLQPLYREILDKYEDPEQQGLVARYLNCPPQHATDTLAYLDERYGGTRAYLRKIGLSGDEMNRLRARLVS